MCNIEKQENSKLNCSTALFMFDYRNCWGPSVWDSAPLIRVWSIGSALLPISRVWAESASASMTRTRASEPVTSRRVCPGRVQSVAAPLPSPSLIYSLCFSSIVSHIRKNAAHLENEWCSGLRKKKINSYIQGRIFLKIGKDFIL